MGSNVLIILGMHRSGTSLTANWLNRCGLNVGDNLEVGNFSNVKGHFEDIDFLELHEALLDESGLHRWGLYDLRDFPLGSEQKKRVGALVTKKNKLRPQWGWKEPRTCLFLDPYKELLPEAKYFVVFRDIGSVVSSLMRRDVGLAVAEKEFRGVFKKIKKNIYIKRLKIEIFNKYKDAYTMAWKIYNNKLYEHLKCLDKNNYLVFNYEKIFEYDNKIIDYFKRIGFELNYINFGEIFDSSLISDIQDDSVFSDSESSKIDACFSKLMDESIQRI